MKPNNHIIFLLLLFCLYAFSPSVLSQDQEKKKKKVKKISLLDQLLMEELPQLEVNTNVKEVYADWRLQNYHWGAATISLAGEEILKEDIKVKTRGKYRSKHCENPPIKIKFPKKRLKARNLKKWNEFKVVYPCQSKSQYQTYVLKEYLVYKLYNVLTDYSLRTQLVDLVLSDSAGVLENKYFKGFLIEHREEFIKRTDAVMSDMKCMRPNHLDTYSYTLFQVFQFLIGNTDWLLPTCKNSEIVSLESGLMVPIPYDFDFSGMVSAEYATPDPAFGLYSVRERYFLGHQKSLEELEPVFELFKEKREDLIKVIENFEYLSKRERKAMIGYLKSFYKILDKPKKIKKIFVHPMAETMAKDY